MILPCDGGTLARNKPTNVKCKRISEIKARKRTEQNNAMGMERDLL